MKKLVYTLGGFAGFMLPTTYLFYRLSLAGARSVDLISLLSLMAFFPLLAYYLYHKDKRIKTRKN